ncbi:MAG: threonine synthase [Paludibaculum sp.]
MYYQSTRGSLESIWAAEAIITGIAPDGGLFVPEKTPRLSLEEIKKLSSMDYNERAKTILALFLDDFTKEELAECVEKAYDKSRFDHEAIAPLVKLNDNIHILELWHGPTCAFKDMALQILPWLLVKSVRKMGETDEIVILVATSGDTGKAALEGFKDVEGTRIIVFFPEEGVSEVQKMQMITQTGKNVYAIGVDGNFDDAQSGVKEIFGDTEIKDEMLLQGFKFSSANSINWGRLVPQIVYYFSAYADLLKEGAISEGEKINFAVPTGNFGNILAGYYAKEMGLPVNKLICASNDNNVLTDFIRTGTYDRNRDFMKTISPSMDILISATGESGYGIAVRDRLAQRRQVGCDAAELLVASQRCAGSRGDHLVEDQEDVVALRSVCGLPRGSPRQELLTHTDVVWNRLRRSWPRSVPTLFSDTCATSPSRLLNSQTNVSATTADEDPADTGSCCPELLLRRDDVHGQGVVEAVIAALELDDPGAPGDRARQADGVIGRFAARNCRAEPVARRDVLDDLPRQFDLASGPMPTPT